MKNQTLFITKRRSAKGHLRITTHHLIRILHIILVFLSLLAILKSIFVSFDIDEGYAIAQSYRLLKGDLLIDEMWEPHQLSAFLSAIFMLPFLAITGGSTTGIIIYLRIIGSLIHLLIAIWFYFVAKKQFNSTVGLLIALVHINFLPKWVSTPEFEVMHYWAVCVLFLGLLSWNRSRKKFYLIVSSVALFVALMSYPTMIILYPAYVFAILKFTKEDRRAKWSAVFWFTTPVFILGLLFLGYLFSYMTLSELLENISYILMDESHSYSLSYRFGQYMNELRSFASQFFLYLSVSFLVVILSKKFLSAKGTLYRIFTPELVPTLLLFTVIFLSCNQLLSSVLGDTNQFYLYFRFLVIALFGIACTFLSKKDTLEYVLLGIIPGALSVIASAALTNMTLEAALARIYIAVIASCFIAGNFLQSKQLQDNLFRNLAYVGAVIFLLSLLMSKLLLVRVTGCIPISLKMHMELVTDGPAAGLFLKEELAQCYNENTAFIKENIAEDDHLLYFGCENIYYLITAADMATPSTQGTSVFNEMYLQYYEEHPEKMPNVVIIDKTFDTNPDYYYAEQNQIVLDWIMETFADASIVETEYLIILRKQIPLDHLFYKLHFHSSSLKPVSTVAPSMISGLFTSIPLVANN